MNFEQWRVCREQIVTEHDQLLRLDCMNPFHAVDHLVDKSRLPTSGKQVPAKISDLHNHLAEAMRRAFSVAASEKALVMTLGIRSFLSLFFESFIGINNRSVWIPADVFPTYGVLARKAGWAVETFATLPNPSWQKQSGNAEVALLPVPLSPLGRDLNAQEYHFWNNWLRADSNRVLLMDSVYAYQPNQCEQMLKLREHPQSICMWSVSKTWIERCVFGFAEVPTELQSRFAEARFPELEYSTDEVQLQRNLSELLRLHPDMPARQAERFVLQWAKLEFTIQKANASWRKPESGYFSTLPIHYENLLNEHNLLAVPASVFGSSQKDLSVITCLYDIKADDEASPQELEP